MIFRTRNHPLRWVMLGGGLGFLVAAAIFTDPVPRAPAAPSTMSALDRLVAKDEILEKLALYSLLGDGDGEKRDPQAWANTVFTKDAVFEAYYPNGTQAVQWNGRDDILKNNTSHLIPLDGPIANRHFFVSTVFDELTPASAKTRSTLVLFDITKNMLGADCAKAGADACGGQIKRALMIAYHDTWEKTPQGWQKSHSTLRNDN